MCVCIFERERARKHARLFIYSFIHSLSFCIQVVVDEFTISRRNKIKHLENALKAVKKASSIINLITVEEWNVSWNVKLCAFQQRFIFLSFSLFLCFSPSLSLANQTIHFCLYSHGVRFFDFINIIIIIIARIRGVFLIQFPWQESYKETTDKNKIKRNVFAYSSFVPRSVPLLRVWRCR